MVSDGNFMSSPKNLDFSEKAPFLTHDGHFLVRNFFRIFFCSVFVENTSKSCVKIIHYFQKLVTWHSNLTTGGIPPKNKIIFNAAVAGLYCKSAFRVQKQVIFSAAPPKAARRKFFSFFGARPKAARRFFCIFTPFGGKKLWFLTIFGSLFLGSDVVSLSLKKIIKKMVTWHSNLTTGGIPQKNIIILNAAVADLYCKSELRVQKQVIFLARAAKGGAAKNFQVFLARGQRPRADLFGFLPRLEAKKCGFWPFLGHFF